MSQNSNLFSSALVAKLLVTSLHSLRPEQKGKEPLEFTVVKSELRNTMFSLWSAE